MFYKKLWVAVMVLALFTLCVSGAAAQELTEVYSDPDNGFSVSYPENWLEGELEGALVWLYDEETSSELIVVKEEIPEGFTAKQYADAVGEWLEQNLEEYSEESLTEGTLSGAPSFTRVYSFSLKGEEATVSIKTLEIYTVKDDYGLAVLCDTTSENFASMEGLFKKMVASFKFLEEEKPN
ncbi:MAG TPA: PsbP-related protein [bacterium]|nr:PsbP-related protein [bacterium]